jgi:hypothetical protein
MGYMEDVPLIMLAIFAAVLLAASVVVIRSYVKTVEKRHLHEHSTNFLDGGSGELCAICFGELGKTVSECGCGKRFHVTCAEPTGSCPYCSRPYSTFKTMEEHKKRCPNCGRYPLGRVCKCGTLIPQDGMLICTCGNIMEGTDPTCGKCGKKYRTERSQ